MEHEIQNGSDVKPVIKQVFVGAAVHATEDVALVTYNNAAIGVDTDGKIAFLCEKPNLEILKRQWKFMDDKVTRLETGEVLMPGMVDSHVHAPQFSVIGTANHLPLFDWIDKYIFAAESKFADTQFAQTEYTKVIRKSLRRGTTTAVYIATIHTAATLLLCEIAAQSGQRAFVGRCAMDVNRAGKWIYAEETAKALQESKLFIEEVLKKKYKRVSPVVTPRFALSSTTELLDGLGKLASEYSCPIQTHISESIREVELVAETFPTCKHYVDVYDKANLLNNKTLLGHGIHLSDDEVAVIRHRNSSIVHCPNSNISLFSGLMDARTYLDCGVNVCLGTDVAGGSSISVLDAIKRTMDVSHTISILRKMEGKYYSHIEPAEAFRMATLNGARALGISDRVGNFAAEKYFDAIVVDLQHPDSPVAAAPGETLETTMARFLTAGSEQQIVRVYVSGDEVFSKSKSLHEKQEFED